MSTLINNQHIILSQCTYNNANKHITLRVKERKLEYSLQRSLAIAKAQNNVQRPKLLQLEARYKDFTTLDWMII